MFWDTTVHTFMSTYPFLLLLSSSSSSFTVVLRQCSRLHQLILLYVSSQGLFHLSYESSRITNVLNPWYKQIPSVIIRNYSRCLCEIFPHMTYDIWGKTQILMNDWVVCVRHLVLDQSPDLSTFWNSSCLSPNLIWPWVRTTLCPVSLLFGEVIIRQKLIPH